VRENTTSVVDDDDDDDDDVTVEDPHNYQLDDTDADQDR